MYCIEGVTISTLSEGTINYNSLEDSATNISSTNGGQTSGFAIIIGINNDINVIIDNTINYNVAQLELLIMQLQELSHYLIKLSLLVEHHQN